MRQAGEDAFKAMSLLTHKFAPAQHSDLTSLQQEFMNCTPQSAKSDPDLWFNEIYLLNECFLQIDSGHGKKDWELQAHVLANLPKEYSEVHTKLSGTAVSYEE